jgi:hypothetical protein
MPGLLRLKARLVGEGVRALTVFAQARLSAGLALGYTFRETTGFALAILDQHGLRWETGRVSGGSAPLTSEVIEVPGVGTDTTVEISSPTVDVTPAVDRWIADARPPLGRRIPIVVTEERVAAAQGPVLAQEIARIMLEERRRMPPAGTLHLMGALPFGVAVLLAWRLNTCAPVQCYELVQNVYRESCRLI